jgi:hypothetical protein
MIEDNYEDYDYPIHLMESDDGTFYLDAEPMIEEITREDIHEIYKNVLKYKPKQFPIGEFIEKGCSQCDFQGILHKKQTFCPLCCSVADEMEGDPNFGFEEVFKKWQERKNLIEKLLSGDIVEFVTEFNKKLPKPMNKYINGEEIIGEEIQVDEE